MILGKVGAPGLWCSAGISPVLGSLDGRAIILGIGQFGGVITRTWALLYGIHAKNNVAGRTRLSLKCLGPGSGRKLPVIWHGVGVYPGVFIPET